MKTFLSTLGFIVVLAFALMPTPVRAQDDSNVSFQTFYDQLASQGNWINTNDYGYVFQPKVNDPNWRPYTYGHWVNTDDGMTWVSDESFGWATYHYGRWVNLADYGWVWVPGYTWAPAWVSWREGDDDVGWAPLPPDTLVGIDFFDPGFAFGFGFHIGDDCDQAFGIGPWCYNFCPVAYIGDPYCWRHFRDRRDNFGFIGRTRNVTNINFRNDARAGRFGRVHANGPSVARLNARSRTPIQQARLTSASTLAANGRLHGNSLSVFAPKVDPSTAKTARPASVATTLATTNVNRGTNINQPLAVNSNIKGPAATSEQIHAATLAQGNAPAGAKIATATSRISRPLTQPLTALHSNVATGTGAGVKTSTTVGGGATPNNAAVTGTTHAATQVPAESRFTGEPVTRHTSIAPTTESRITGEPALRHTTVSPAAESRFTGEPATTHQAITPTRSYSSSATVHPFTSSAGTYQPSRVFHTSSAPAYHPQRTFQSAAPAYHPQPSFRSVAPAQHFGGGAPAAHFSGGNAGGGGRIGGGGGAVRASAGGGGQRQHQ